MSELVITAVGPDRPGLVAELTGYLLKAGANVADSRMINLRGHFAMIMLVQGADAVIATVLRDGQAVAQKIGLAVTLTPHESGAATVRVRELPGAVPSLGPLAGGVPYRLRSYSIDQPGIVHRITHLLSQHGVNIEELQTRLEEGSYTGTPLFNLDLRVTVPQGVPIHDLRRELQELCDSLNCDVELQPA